MGVSQVRGPLASSAAGLVLREARAERRATAALAVAPSSSVAEEQHGSEETTQPNAADAARLPPAPLAAATPAAEARSCEQCGGATAACALCKARGCWDAGTYESCDGSLTFAPCCDSVVCYECVAVEACDATETICADCCQQMYDY